MTGGRRIGEAALVVVAVFALLLSAAFLPTVSLLDSGSVPNDLPGDVNPELPSGLSETGQQQTQLPDIGAPGQIAGGSLSQPPDKTQISGQLSSTSRVPLFTVQSPVNTYWRQTAYSRYTGTGWDRSTERHRLNRCPERRPDERRQPVFVQSDVASGRDITSDGVAAGVGASHQRIGPTITTCFIFRRHPKRAITL
jgi:hypothetical protein